MIPPIFDTDLLDVLYFPAFSTVLILCIIPQIIVVCFLETKKINKVDLGSHLLKLAFLFVIDPFYPLFVDIVLLPLGPFLVIR